jgi:hypothetical protein
VAKIDASWASDCASYISAGGVGGIDERYERFGIWLEDWAKPVELPMLCIDDITGGIAFTDGRHRFAWLRDHGATAIQAQAPSYCADEVAQKFGTDERATLIPA